MSENLRWSLSDGPPDVDHPDGKDEQRDTSDRSYGDRPTHLPLDLRRETQANPEGDSDDPPLQRRVIERNRADARHVADRMQQAIDGGRGDDPLAGAAERGGYVRGENDGA